MRCYGHDFSLLSVVIDFITILPFVGWLIMSLSAIPAYAAISWWAPIACAVVTTIICGLATANMWRRSHSRAVIYLVMEDPMTGSANETKNRCITRCDTWMALICMVICVVWASLCMVANASVRRIEQPCPGLCGNCSVDFHCHAWAKEVRAAHSLTNICPPAQHDEKSTSNATFSCVADAAWMFLTAAFALAWALFLLRPKQAGGRTRKVSAGSEMTGAAPAPPHLA